MVRLHRQVHDQPGTKFPKLKARLSSNIRQATRLGALCQERLLAGPTALPDGESLCHGDFHPWKVRYRVRRRSNDELAASHSELWHFSHRMRPAGKGRKRRPGWVRRHDRIFKNLRKIFGAVVRAG